MNRTLQILGLLLVGLLSMEAKAVHAQQGLECLRHGNGCVTCRTEECLFWLCPIGDPRGVGIYCEW